jgi:hypothetical protein
MENGIETVRWIRFKLRMIGVPLSIACFVYEDNMSVIQNTQCPEYALKNKSNSILYHISREPDAMCESIMTHVSSENNPADIITNVVPAGQKRYHLIGPLLYDLVD